MYRKAIEFINERQANNWVISVDIPTGVDSNTGNVADMAVEADYCFTMGLPKVGHVLPRNGLLQESGGVEHWFPLICLKMQYLMQR